MDITIQSAILAIHVHIDTRVDHRMIERSVEHGLLVGRSLTLQRTEFVVPVGTRLLAERLKRFSRRLTSQVANRPLRAYRRQGHLQRQFMRCSIVKVEICHDVASCHFREVVLKVKLPPETPIVRLLAVLIAKAL